MFSSTCLPVKESSFAQQQLDHFDVPLFWSQMKWCQASLIAFIQQTRVCDGLQQSVACIDAPIPLEKRGMRLWKNGNAFFFLCVQGAQHKKAGGQLQHSSSLAIESLAQRQVRLLLQGLNL